MNTYQFLAEIADRRSKDYKKLDKQLDALTDKYGKESKEVKEFFEREYTVNLNYDIEWVCTDPSNDQYGRQLSKDVYEFKEADFDYNFDGLSPQRVATGDYIQMTIDLSEYDNDSMYHHVCMYYGYKDFEEFLKTNEGRWIIAECIFEQLSGNY